MDPSRPPDQRPPRRPGDAWVECRCGSRHWGEFGAAGVLVVRHGDDGDAVVLQHRALWSHHGGTWGLPGGAIGPDETAVEGAVREAVEEVGLRAEWLRPRATWVLDHPDWSYTTVVADAVAAFEPTVTDAESLDTRWVGVGALADLPLLPAFAASLPELARIMGRRLVLVVDAANTVGSRPDGWWNDRLGATRRLRDELDALASTGVPADAVGLPGHTWFPDVVLVAEGAARGVPSSEHTRVVDAPGSGDDEVVRQVALALGLTVAEAPGGRGQPGGERGAGTTDAVPGTTADLAESGGAVEVVVVTADRALRERVSEIGAGVAGPRLVH
ncbi:NUDIX domain-containing protein [Georgenia sp. MJ206]|uniref:NUDIX domain-containing protein n=1 Tax=Georgenia wangjunii TaxID=3117730 RepID=UPI002F26B609